MAEERSESREVTWRQLLPWTELFRGFQVALDLNKLLLAAAGIFVTWFGWWLLALIFGAIYASGSEGKEPPDWTNAKFQADKENVQSKWSQFRDERLRWNLMNEAVGIKDDARYEVQDFAESPEELFLFTKTQDVQTLLKAAGDRADARLIFLDAVTTLQKNGTINDEAAARYRAKASQYARLGQVKPHGLLAVSPWNEDRGPNPFLLVTGQSGVPWEPGFFWEWFGRDQAPVMVEPLVKFLRPIIYFLSPVNDFLTRLYFLCVVLWTLLVWSIVGGAITRIAAVQLARGEKIGVFEALRFTGRRFLSYAIAPLFVLGFCAVLTLIMMLLYLIGLIPVVGDVVTGIIYPVFFGFGLVMAVALVGLVGWPLMAATISAEGTDSWEAVSRSYSYVYQRPWHFIWYSLVSIAYGGVCLFFIGFMASFAVYLAKWGMAQNPVAGAADREPHYLFVYAPRSFGWRELLLDGAQVSKYQGKEKYQKMAERKEPVVRSRTSRPTRDVGTGTSGRWSRMNEEAYDAYVGESLAWWNKAGALLTAFWLGTIFLLMLGFGYSFFWTSSTIIYLLLRKSVDAAEMDEVYLEEDDYEPSFQASPMPTPAPGGGLALPMVDAVRPGTTPVTAPPPVTATPPPQAIPPTQAPGGLPTSMPEPPKLPSEPPKLPDSSAEGEKPKDGEKPPLR